MIHNSLKAKDNTNSIAHVNLAIYLTGNHSHSQPTRDHHIRNALEDKYSALIERRILEQQD